MPKVDEVITVIIDETGLDMKIIKPSVRLNELGLTSYSLMRILMRLEDHFDCEFDAADLLSVFTIPIIDLSSLIERSTSATS